MRYIVAPFSDLNDIMLLTKSDLLPYVPFSVDAVIKDAYEVNSSIETFVL